MALIRAVSGLHYTSVIYLLQSSHQSIALVFFVQQINLTLFQSLFSQTSCNNALISIYSVMLLFHCLPARATKYGGNSPIAVPMPHKNADQCVSHMSFYQVISHDSRTFEYNQLRDLNKARDRCIGIRCEGFIGAQQSNRTLLIYVSIV